MSAEQGDVERLLARATEYKTTTYKMANGVVLDAEHTLIRSDLDEMCDAVLALAAALERAERERDNARAEETRLREREAVRVTEQSNENERLREALENISTGAWGARAHIADYDVRTYARAALRPSEDTSDEHI